MEVIDKINYKLKDTFRFRVVLFLCSILLISVREPALLLHPRLWAEEGCIFYQYALHQSIYTIFTTVHVGYLTLFNSIVSSLQAKVFPIENAAIVSTYMGFLVQLIPVYIIIFTSPKFWDTPLKKIICSFIIIVVLAPELSLNTTNSHFIFGLVTFLIMINNTTALSRLQKYFFRLLLLIGGLTGPASILFIPTFLVKAYYQKNKEKYIQAAILSICGLIQAFIILYAILYNNTYHRLAEHNYARTISHFFTDNFSMIPHASVSYLHGITFYAGFLFGVLMFVYYVYLLIANKKDSDYVLSLISLFIVGTCSTLGSLHMAGSPRYAYIPSCIFLIVITSEFLKRISLVNKTHYIAGLVLFICLSANTVYYHYGMRNVYADSYPKWKDEVAKWRADNTYKPRVHPGLDAGQCVSP